MGLPRLWLRVACAVLVLSCLALGQIQQTRPKAKQSAPKVKQPAPDAVPQVSEPAPPPSPIEAIRTNNIGAALMDRHEFSEALGKFQTACVMNPESETACLNGGIAVLNMLRYDDAQRLLGTYSERHPENPRVWFNLALLERGEGNVGPALDDLQKVLALDPDDPDTQFFIGFLQAEQGHDQQAVAAFQRCLELDPLHVSAEYALSESLGHLGNAYDSQAHLERYHRLTALGLGKPVRFIYGEQGKYSRTEEMAIPAEVVLPAAPVRWVDVTAVAGIATGRRFATPPPHLASPRGPARAARRGHQPVPATPPQSGDAELSAPSLVGFLGGGACVFDYDGDGRPDIFLVNGDDKGHAALFRNMGNGKFANITKQAGIDFQSEGTGCAVGDYDNDGHPDLAVSSGDGITLFHNEGQGTFKDVTDAAGVHMEGLALGLTFIDYDQDGDLDLYVTRFGDFPLGNPSEPFSFPADAPGEGNVLWRSKGDGTFEDATKQMELAGTAPSVGAIGTHLRNNSIDVVLTGWQKSPSVLLNTREGAFRSASPWAAEMPGPTAGVVAFDFDQDGMMDLAFTHWAPPGLSLWRNVRGKSFERVDLPSSEWMRGFGLAAFDYDSDGLVDLVAVGETFAGEGRIELLRNEGSAGFRDVTRETGLDKIALHNPRSVIAFDFDGTGTPGLLITQSGGPPVLLKQIPLAHAPSSTRADRNNWLALAVAGDQDNRMAIGARVDIFSGARKQSWEVSGASGYLGQGPPEILAGLGTENLADVVRILWPKGPLQDEFQLPGDQRRTIGEAEPPAPAEPAAPDKK